MTMDFSSGKGYGSGNADAKVPKFFKIVLSAETHRLRFPPEFTRRYGDHLQDCVSIMVPNGRRWKVELIHSQGETWLNRGWQQFEEYYSIRFGHFLLFKYVGDSRFVVHIFDKSATEIEYSRYASLDRGNCSNDVAEMEGVESDSDESVVFLKENLGRKNVRSNDGRVADHTSDVEKIENCRPLTRKMKRRMKESDHLHSEKLRKSSRTVRLSSPVKKEPRFVASSPKSDVDVAGCSESRELKCLDRVQQLLQANNANNGFKSYKKALAFMSKKPPQNPFSVVVLYPSHVEHRRLSMNIPRAFAKEILLGRTNSMIFRVLGGETWPVRCIWRTRKPMLSSGWRAFVEGNDLRVGDTCVFEVAERTSLVWNVTVFRG